MEINNCSSCGGKVEFSPKDKGLKCVKCGNVYPIDYKQEVEKKPVSQIDQEDSNGYKDWENSSRSFQCTNCGAQIVMNKFEMANICQYCHTSSLIPLEKLPGLKPDLVVPFKISKEEASSVFKERVKHKWFLPKEFKKKVPSADIGATYISSFNFAMHVFATYTATEYYTVTVTVNGESRTETRSRQVSGSVDKQFNNIVVEASDKISQQDIDAILPFNFAEAYDYDSDFIKGYNVGYYNQSAGEAFVQARNIADSNVERIIRGRYESLSFLKVNSAYNDEKYSYSLLPVYFVKYKYKGKDYFNLMNGQNGNVGGGVPRSAVKITFFTLFILLLVVGVPLLIFLLTTILN